MKIVCVSIEIAVEGESPGRPAEVSFVVNPAMPTLTSQLVDGVLSAIRARIDSTVERIHQEAGR